MPQNTFKPTLDEVMADLEAFLNSLEPGEKEALMLAVSLAMYAHQGQFRKANPDCGLTAQEYIIHPIRVMLILAQEVGNRDVPLLVAALLHDAIEDGEGRIAVEMITRRFTKDASTLVEYVTKPQGKMTDEEHAAYYERIALFEQAILLKMADRIDNLRDALTLSDKKFQLKQLRETRKYFLKLAVGTHSHLRTELLRLLDQLEAHVQ